MAADAGAELAGLAIQVSASQLYGQTYAGGSLSLETAASWLVIVAEQERRAAPIAIARALRRLPALFSRLPLTDLDELATGGQVTWYREAMAHRHREDAYWVVRDYTAGVTKVAAPVQLIGGWYDIFLPWMLEDFCALQAAGREVQLIIGPWTHTAPGGMAAGVREGLGWLRAHLLGDDRLARRAPVRLRVTGEAPGGGWRELATWPPPGTGGAPPVANGFTPPRGAATCEPSQFRRPVPLRPERSNAVDRWPGAPGARAGGRQPPIGSAARRRHVHHDPAPRVSSRQSDRCASSYTPAPTRLTSTCSRGSATWMSRAPPGMSAMRSRAYDQSSSSS